MIKASMRYINCSLLFLLTLLLSGCNSLYHKDWHYRYYYAENQTDSIIVMTTATGASSIPMIYDSVDTINVGDRVLFRMTMDFENINESNTFLDRYFTILSVVIMDLNWNVLAKWENVWANCSAGIFNIDNWDIYQDYRNGQYYDYCKFIITEDVLSEQ